MDVAPASSTLRAKAWFFLGDEIVCLGADIRATGGKSINTVVENRRLKSTGSNTFRVNNSAAVTPVQAGTVTPVPLNGVNYAHLTGNVSGGDIGYYFPGGSDLKAVRESRSRSWTDINQRPNRLDYNGAFTKYYLTLYYDHGVNPTAASYSDAILPNRSAAQVQSYADSPQYTVLENSPAAQAVRDSANPAIAAVFWQDAVKTVGTATEAITSDQCAVVFGSTTDVAISSPIQTSTATVNLEIAWPASGLVGSPGAGIVVTQFSPTIKIAFSPTNTKGRTSTVRFSSAAVPITVTVDNADPGVTLTGSWAVSSAQADRTGANYLHDYNSGAIGGKKVTFTPNVTVTRSYDVYLMWSANANRANSGCQPLIPGIEYAHTFRCRSVSLVGPPPRRWSFGICVCSLEMLDCTLLVSRTEGAANRCEDLWPAPCFWRATAPPDP